MNTDTQTAYRSLATHFYTTRFPEIPVSALDELDEFRIIGALLRAAPEYRPDYFRRLRNALALDQKLRGQSQDGICDGAPGNGLYWTLR